MIEITNKKRSPIQVMVRSKKHPRAFTTLVVPGVGAGKNVVVLEDERWTKQMDQLQNAKLISMRKITNQCKGE